MKSEDLPLIRRVIVHTIISTIIGALVGAGVWFKMPAVYRSTALIKVSASEFRTDGVAEKRENTVEMPFLAETVVSNFEGHLLASRIAQRLGGDASPEAISKMLGAKSSGASLVKVSATASSAQEAKRILDAAVELSIVLEKERFTQAMKPLSEGIDAQLATLQQSISDHFKQISAYAGDRPDMEDRRISGAGQAGIQASIAQLAAQTEDARFKLANLNSSVTALEKSESAIEGIQDFGESSYSFSDLKRQIAEKASALASLQSRYGVGNPQVEAASADLKETKRFLVQGLSELAQQVETKLAGLVAARKSLEENSAALKQQSMAVLDRDPTYNTLVTAKDSLVMAYQQLLIRKHDLAITSQLQPPTLALLDVPDLPPQPYITMKLAYAGAAMLLTAGCGFMLALLASGLLSRLLIHHESK